LKSTFLQGREIPGFFAQGCRRLLGVFDLHCDTITECEIQRQELRENQLHLSLERGRRYTPWAQCFAIWIPDEMRGNAAIDWFGRIYRRFQEELRKNADWMLACKTKEDLLQAEQERKCAAILTVEGGAALAGDLSRVKTLADCGVRMLTLTWNGSCELGDGALVANPKGLTEFGQAAIPELERCGILLDVSHASEPLFYQVAQRATRPFLATHSNAKTVCDHPRNLTDSQFQILKEQGGLVGLNFYPPFLTDRSQAGLDDILRHAEHFLSLGGEDVLALGSDFDGAAMPKGMEGVQSLERLAEHFAKSGYPNWLIEKIFYKNARNFLVSL
jgi:membrane dipeptidase